MFMIATLYTIVGVMTTIGDPLNDFLWITTSLFLAFYLIRILPDDATAVGFAFLLAGAIPLWDDTQLTLTRVLRILSGYSFPRGRRLRVAVAVEDVFRGVHPITDLLFATENRLKVIEDVLRQIAADLPLSGDLKKRDLVVFRPWHFQRATTVTSR